MLPHDSIGGEDTGVILASGKRVFVKPMLVGDEKNGKIIKDYIVEEPAHAH
jgi:hypothetical protein